MTYSRKETFNHCVEDLLWPRASTAVPDSPAHCLRTIRAYSHTTDALTHGFKVLGLSPALSACSSLLLGPSNFIRGDKTPQNQVCGWLLSPISPWMRGNSSMWRGNWVLTHTDGYMPSKQNTLFPVKTRRTNHRKAQQWCSSLFIVILTGSTGWIEPISNLRLSN